MATPYPGYTVRGEHYAEVWANNYADRIWDYMAESAEVSPRSDCDCPGEGYCKLGCCYPPQPGP